MPSYICSNATFFLKLYIKEDMLDITHTYSKDVEPLEENIETLEKVFESNEVFSMEEIIISYKEKKNCTPIKYKCTIHFYMYYLTDLFKITKNQTKEAPSSACPSPAI